MLELAKRANITVSEIRKIFAQISAIKAKRLEEGLAPLIDLSIGQPHLPPNPDVMHKLNTMHIPTNVQGYTAAQGEPETLAAIVKLYGHYYPEVTFKTSETMVTLGGSGALSNIFSILVEKKEDVILTFEPYFAAYSGQIQEWGGSLQKIPTLKNNFRPTAEALEQALQNFPKTKALILNYPNNPSGVSLSRQEAVALAEVLEKYPDVVIIIDDVYRDFDQKQHVTVLNVAPQLKERCVLINSGAKGLLGAPGERIGMIAAAEKLISSMLPRQTNGMSSVPYRTQAALRYAVETYLNNPENNWLMYAKEEYKNNTIIATTAFKKYGFNIAHDPEGAFYLLASAKHLIGRRLPNSEVIIQSDVDLSQYFLQVAGVAVVPGSGFGIDPKEGFLRISCANDSAFLIEAAQRMDKATKELILIPVQEIKESISQSLLALGAFAHSKTSASAKEDFHATVQNQ